MSNPFRFFIEAIGRGLAHTGWIQTAHVRPIADLAWPRILTGLARMSKATADLAMIGMAIGAAGIAGIGYGVPYWTLAYMVGGGIAGGTISLVSQRFGANRPETISTVLSISTVYALGATLPLLAVFWMIPEPLIRLIGSGEEAIRYGTDYLQIASLAMPFAALNLVSSRALVGANEAWIPMVVRAGGALANIGFSAFLIFGLDLGVVGAALGTVIGTASVTVVFGIGLVRGRLPIVGKLPIQWQRAAPQWDRTLSLDFLRIASPLALRKLTQGSTHFPMLAIVSMFGPQVVAAYVVAIRVRGLMNTPGWGFGLASSSLVGQALGRHDETEARTVAQDTLRFTVATYLLVATAIFIGATPVARLFVQEPEVIPLTAGLIRAACVSVVLKGLMNGAIGPLRASGDTTWPFYGQLAGLLFFSLPLAYTGATTALALWGLYLALVAEKGVPAAVAYYRYHTQRWLAISRRYRTGTASH